MIFLLLATATWNTKCSLVWAFFCILMAADFKRAIIRLFLWKRFLNSWITLYPKKAYFVGKNDILSSADYDCRERQLSQSHGDQDLSVCEIIGLFVSDSPNCLTDTLKRFSDNNCRYADSLNLDRSLDLRLAHENCSALPAGFTSNIAKTFVSSVSTQFRFVAIEMKRTQKFDIETVFPCCFITGLLSIGFPCWFIKQYVCFCYVCWKRKGKLGAHAMKRVAASAHLQAP